MNKIDLEKLKEIKQRITKSGMSRLYISLKIGIPYGTLSAQLNGFSIMPDHVEDAIEEVLNES